MDDVINCKGHRIGTAELECALVTIVTIVHGVCCIVIILQNSNEKIAETAVVSYPHEIFGEGMLWMDVLDGISQVVVP